VAATAAGENPARAGGTGGPATGWATGSMTGGASGAVAAQAAQNSEKRDTRLMKISTPSAGPITEYAGDRVIRAM